MAHLRMWSDYRLFGQMSLCIRAARSEPGGQPDEMHVYRVLGQAENCLRRALSMCIALTMLTASSTEESLLLSELTKLARIQASEKAVVEAEFKTPAHGKVSSR